MVNAINEEKSAGRFFLAKKSYHKTNPVKDFRMDFTGDGR